MSKLFDDEEFKTLWNTSMNNGLCDIPELERKAEIFSQKYGIDVKMCEKILKWLRDRLRYGQKYEHISAKYYNEMREGNKLYKFMPDVEKEKVYVDKIYVPEYTDLRVEYQYISSRVNRSVITSANAFLIRFDDYYDNKNKLTNTLEKLQENGFTTVKLTWQGGDCGHGSYSIVSDSKRLCTAFMCPLDFDNYEKHELLGKSESYFLLADTDIFVKDEYMYRHTGIGVPC